MGDKEDYLTLYRVFFENFAENVNPEDQLPVNIAGYTITESELPGEVLYWITQYLTEKQCPLTLMTPLRRIILDEVRVASKKNPNEFGYKSDESVYIALRLMQAVTARVNAVCLRYLDNSRLDSLPPPPPLAQRDLKTVSCATKNSRRVMEDRHVEIGNLEALFGIDTTEPTSFYAVYDGHAGSAAATYCAAHLHQYLVESPHFTADLRKAMREAFLRTDAEFIRKSNQERACGGSTAVAVTIRGKQLLAAWAGDSLALLAKRMRLMQLVRPHKPSREDERDRIEASGGSVMYWGTWRVNGQLAVSRAIGDAQYKPYVTARPEIATVDLDGDEDFVVVACDGLWDFVSEDDVALAVYRQLAADPDDLKAVTKRLIVQAKRQGSADNISIIVVFLKDPRDIAADNRPPMDLGLDNALANAPPFAGETEACKRQTEAAAIAVDAEADADADAGDNGVDNSDSDSEDLGPETAVDADDIDAERNHEPAPPTPPAHAVEAGHVDGTLVDNVAESGDESEDEWNYFKGEGEREEHNPTEEPDELPRSETPGQDNSAWETSSVDMNSSPLNPDAPVFIPGTVAGSEVLLAESPRKPVPMDDIELPDVAQFETEAVVRPAELLDLDNCDQLNGHHNVSINDAVKEHLNGNDKCTMDSLGFGFNVGIEPDKVKDSGLIQDFERIQKDTTDFCNIQVFQTHSETNPFAVESNDELFERLKNKERDPMSMSFYQEKDDDTCERISKNDSRVDLNAVQPLPDSDDEDLQPNGVCDNEKENISPDQHMDLFGTGDSTEPNNDIMRFDERADNLSHNIANFGQGDNCMEYLVSSSNNMSYPNIELESGNTPQDTIMQTDTPESHKLLFEQIPEIPDGKSSELGFTNDDNLDPSESEKDPRASTPQDETSQDIEMESKLEDSPLEELQPELLPNEHVESDRVISPGSIHLDEKTTELIPESAPGLEIQQAASLENLPISPAPIDDRTEEAITPEPTHGRTDVSVDVHRNDIDEIQQILDDVADAEIPVGDSALQAPEDDHIEDELALAVSPHPTLSPLPGDPTASSPRPTLSPAPSAALASPLPTQSPLPSDAFVSTSPLPAHSPLPRDAAAASPLISRSPAPQEVARSVSPEPRASPVPHDTLQPSASPAPQDTLRPSASPAPEQLSESVPSPLPQEPSAPTESPLPEDIQRDSLLATDASLLRESPLLRETEAPLQASAPVESPLPVETLSPTESQVPIEALLTSASPLPNESQITVDAISVTTTEGATLEALLGAAPSPLPADVPLPGDSPAPPASPAPREPTALEPEHSTIETESAAPAPDAESALAAVEPATEVAEEAPLAAAPAPDLVPEPRTDLVTDVDVGVSESRAQEICVPVTCEIRLEDGEQRAATPPPTPAADTLTTAPLVAAAAVAATAAVAAAAAATTKLKTTPAKKSPTTPTAKTEVRTPRSAPRPTATTPRTPASATKRPATSAAARTPGSATRTAPVRPPTAAPKPAAAPAAKTSAAPRVPPSRPAAARPASATTAPKPAAKPSAPAAPRAAPAPRSAPAPRAPAAPRPAPARPLARSAPTATSATSKPLPRAAPPATSRPAPAAPKTRKLPEKKPLTNGDVKETKTSPRPPPITRPAPRPAPRTTPATTAAPAAPKAGARTARAPLDKQSKDLANKRLTAKAAPPRTAVTKAAVSAKTTATKVGPKKPQECKEPAATNGEGATEKAPPSPPADNALLPDVIA